MTCGEVFCKPGTTNPRSAVECNGAQARIIGQRRQTSPLTGMARLEQCILQKRRMNLLGLLDSKFALRQQFNAQRAQQGLQLLQLPAVARGQHKAIEIR